MRPGGGSGTSEQKFEINLSIGNGASIKTILYKACYRDAQNVSRTIELQQHKACSPYLERLAPEIKEWMM